MTANEVRRNILNALYEHHRDDAHASVETSALVRELGIDDLKEFWEDVRFLHDEAYLDGTPVPYMREGYLERAKITRKGIDLVDNPAELDRAFPVDPEHLVVEEFLHEARLGFERSGLSGDEKERLFLHLEKLAAHPGALKVLHEVLRKCFVRG